MNQLINFLKTISDETRLRILVLLMHKEMCVCEICDVLNESQPKISRHLSRLRNSGYVVDDRQGQWVYYIINIDIISNKEIMEIILKRIDEFPQLKKDVEILKKKISEGTLCTRSK